MELEHFFLCPYCNEEISFLLDLSEEEASYIEDCQVCCRPIQVTFTASGGGLVHFDAQAS